MSGESHSVPLLEVEDLSVEFRTRSGTVHALDHVGFELQRGETLALVGDQQCRFAGKRHRNHHPLAHTTRQFERVCLRPPLRIGDAHLGEHLDRALWRLRGGDVAVPQQDVGDLLADRADRVECGARALEDDRQFTAADLADGLFARL